MKEKLSDILNDFPGLPAKKKCREQWTLTWTPTAEKFLKCVAPHPEMLPLMRRLAEARATASGSYDVTALHVRFVCDAEGRNGGIRPNYLRRGAE